MSSKSKENNQYSKKILKILGEKSAISLPELAKRVNIEECSQNSKYAVTRSLKGLREAGLIEQIPSPQNEYARLTKEGRKKMHSLELESDTTLVNTSWDGFWRIILLDLPNSAWISPFPFEHLFMNIKKDLGLTTEMMIIVTEFIDEESKKVLFETFGK